MASLFPSVLGVESVAFQHATPLPDFLEKHFSPRHIGDPLGALDLLGASEDNIGQSNLFDFPASSSAELLPGSPSSSPAQTAAGPTDEQQEGTTIRKAKTEASKNAQKRFRERQKQMLTTLEQEVAEKSALYDQLCQENTSLKLRAKILEKVVVCRDEQLDLLRKFQAACKNNQAHKLTAFGTDNIPSCSSEEEKFKNMTFEQVLGGWKAFLSEVSGALLSLSAPGGNPSDEAKITASANHIGYLMKHVIVINPAIPAKMLGLNLESCQSEAPPDNHWQTVVSALQLTAAQRTDIIAVLELYRGLLVKIYDERKLLKTALSTAVTSCDSPHQTLNSLHAAFSSEAELVDRLTKNLAKEQGAQALLCCFLYGKVLSCVQFAKVAFHSYPYFPDSLAIATTVASLAPLFPSVELKEL